MGKSLRTAAGLIWRFIVALSFVVTAVASIGRQIELSSFLAAFEDVVTIIRDVMSSVWTIPLGPLLREVCAVEVVPQTPIFDALGLLALLTVSLVFGISAAGRGKPRSGQSVLADFIGAVGLVGIAVSLPLTLAVIQDARLDDLVGELGQSPLAPATVFVTFAFIASHWRGDTWLQKAMLAPLRLFFAATVVLLLVAGAASFLPVIWQVVEIGAGTSPEDTPRACDVLQFFDAPIEASTLSQSGPSLIVQVELRFVAQVFAPALALLLMLEMRFGRPCTLGRRFADTLAVSAVVLVLALIGDLAGWIG